MKITGGVFKGRILKTPKGIRPAQSMIRKAIFDTLGEMTGKRVVDIFAGSGSLGFEALSRGAQFCVFVEKDGRCVKVIEENARILNVMERVKILKMDFREFLNKNKEKFDLIFVDPPYKRILKEREIMKTIEFLEKGGFLVMETRREVLFSQETRKFIFKEVVYGQTKITYFTCGISGEF